MRINNIPTKEAAEQTLKNYKNNTDAKAFEKLKIVEDRQNGNFAITNRDD